MDSRVFLVEPVKAGIDISGAEAHGELRTLFGHACHGRIDQRRQQRRRPSTTNLQAFAEEVARALDEEQYDPAVDLVLMTGGTLQLACTALALASRHDRFVLLIYSANTEEYVVKSFDFAALKGNTSPCRSTDTTSSTRA